MALSKHQQWIADQLAATGVSQSELARQIGLDDPSKVNRIVRGLRRVQPDELERAEAFFASLAQGTPPTDNARPVRATMVPTPVSGQVSAGLFQEIDALGSQDPDEVLVARDPRYPQARIVVFDVGGNSMNAFDPPIPDGARVSGPVFEDTREVPRTGMAVIIQRSTSDGQMIEWSVKELEVRDDGYTFHPRSTDPRYKPIVVDTDLHADDGKTVEIVALVTDVTRPVRW
ncbi:LexA family protein [Ancylobacter sp. IITR112]|uniref:LexA family protein n=1 Tax=Ancylobacter sp. IITR112 TaxID=3138073 RepID=UPI00352AD6DA